MSGKSLLCYFVHSVASDLNFYPKALFGHESNVQSLVSVGFRMVDPVSYTVGMNFVDVAYCYIYLEAFIYFVASVFGLEDNAYGKNVIYLIERNVLVLHFAPNGVGAFDACFYLIVNPHFVQSFSYGSSKLLKQSVTLLLCRG